MKQRRLDLNSCYCLYALILEANDEAAGVVKFYQACVRLHDSTEGMWLEEFIVFSDDGDERLRLYHHLGNVLYIHIWHIRNVALIIYECLN